MSGNLVNTFVEEPFRNDIGQTLNPGDKVVCVTTGYGHQVSVFQGVFEGTYRGNRYDKGKIVGTRVGQVPVVRGERVYGENGEHEETKYTSKYDEKGRYIGYSYEPTGRRYNIVYHTKYRKSALRLNRVYKIDTNVLDMKF